MLETLHNIDEAVFIFLNVKLANPVFDTAMPIITADNLLRVLYGVAMALVLWKGPSNLRWLVLFSAIALLLSDQLSSHVLKPLIGRPRPCHVLEAINLLVGCGGGKAMPSSHAANAFGQAVLFSLGVPRVRWYLLTFAGLVAVSRVFVGVHYPGDVLAGSILGSVCGLLVFGGFSRVVIRKALRQRQSKAAKPPDEG